jgi:hypothetical protein
VQTLKLEDVPTDTDLELDDQLMKNQDHERMKALTVVTKYKILGCVLPYIVTYTTYIGITEHEYSRWRPRPCTFK